MLTSSRTSGSASAAWWFVLAAATVAVALALFHDTNPDTNFFHGLSKQLLSASKLTALLLAAAGTIATALGILIGVCRSSRLGWLQFLGGVYVETFRGIPLLVLILTMHFGIRPWFNKLEFGIAINDFWSAVLSIGIAYAAFIGEAVRAGIEAIPTEEIEAASLEGTRGQVLFHVVLPQALRLILPAWTNEIIAMLKDTSLVYAVALTDLNYAAKIFGMTTGRVFEAYAAVAVVYLVLTLLLSRAARAMERAWHSETIVPDS